MRMIEEKDSDVSTESTTWIASDMCIRTFFLNHVSCLVPVYKYRNWNVLECVCGDCVQWQDPFRPQEKFDHDEDHLFQTFPFTGVSGHGSVKKKLPQTSSSIG